LLCDVDFDDAVMQEEIFGPILPVVAYTNLSDAITSVKRLPHPLACYVFAQTAEVQDQIISQVPFGGGTINDTVLHIANPHLPFGGVGGSGKGRYHGEAGFRAFSNDKSILHKSNWLDLPLRYSPLTPTKLTWLKRLMFWSSRLP
jgi:aldehyde dehydrogenase (NAD+)